MAQLRAVVIVDELAAAEDLAATLAKALQAMLEDPCCHAELVAADALAEFAGYCRPSCGYLDDGECHADDPGRCGCICGHHDEIDPLQRDDLRPHLTAANHPPTGASLL